MKSVIIFYAQSLTEDILNVLSSMSIRGYSKWVDMVGKGSFDGEPHLGSHAWPALNSGIMTVVEEAKVELLFSKLRELDSRTNMQGLRAYSWNIENTI